MFKIRIIIFTGFFALLLFACKKDSAPQSTSSDLAGTKWNIYQYKDATTTAPQTRNDTLIFIDATHYKFNNQSYNYSLTTGTYTHLTLYGTPFGDLDGTVPSNFISNGEIIDLPFSQLKISGALTYFLWIKKM